MTEHKRVVKEIKYVINHVGNSGRIYLPKTCMGISVRITLVNDQRRGNEK
ncbi:MAG TPA: hypothetical protein VH500_21830 [Nitrososphaeraceae archaeon]|jgi:putative transposon-encoded protein